MATTTMASAPPNPVHTRRRLGSIPYAAGSRQSIELDRDGVLLSANIRLRYTVTNGATAPQTPLFMTIARLIRRVEVIVGGRDTIMSMSGEQMAARHFFEYGNAPFGFDAQVSVAANGTTAVDISLPVDFSLPLGRRMDDTGLDLRGGLQASLLVTWGSIVDLFGTPGATAAISGVTCEVEGHYHVNPRADAVYLTRAIDSNERDLPGNSEAFDMPQDKGTGLVYLSFMVLTLADRVGVTGILDPGTIRLESGSFVYQNRHAVAVRAENLRRVGSSAILPHGVYFVDPRFDGSLMQGIVTENIPAELRFIFNAVKVTGTNTIVVNREAIRPLKLR